MMSLYVYGGIVAAILAIIGGLWIALKVKTAQVVKADEKAHVAMATALSAQTEIAQTNKTADAVAVVKNKLTTEQKVEQVKFDATPGGDRSFMESDTPL
jgi:hypothetical protein